MRILGAAGGSGRFLSFPGCAGSLLPANLRTWMVLLLGGFLTSAPAATTFERTYPTGVPWNDVSQTSDGGYVFSCGGHDSVGENAVYLLKTDSLGDVEFCRSYTGPGNNGLVPGGSCITSDGQYVLAGVCTGTGIGDGWAALTDPVGDTIWTYLHAGPGLDDFRSVTATSDSGCVIAGRFSEGGAVGMALLKLSRNGERQWVRVFSPPGTSTEGFTACETPDGGLVANGIIRDDSLETPDDDYLVRTDSLGETVWTVRYRPEIPGHYAIFHGSVCVTADGGYALCGTSVPLGGWTQTCYLARFNSAGVNQWTRVFDESLTISRTYLRCVQSTPDHGFVLVGERYRYRQGNDEGRLLLVRLDSLGDTLWTREFDGLDPRVTDYGVWVINTRDGGFAIEGEFDDDGVYLIKTDSMGLVYSSVTDGAPGPLLSLSATSCPNPFRGKTMIVLAAGVVHKTSVLRVYDAAGRLVRDLPVARTVAWDGRDDLGRPLPAGTYSVEARAGTTSCVARLVMTD